jgi:hypothetical protein
MDECILERNLRHSMNAHDVNTVFARSDIPMFESVTSFRDKNIRAFESNIHMCQTQIR